MKTDKELAVELMLAYLNGGNVKSDTSNGAQIEVIAVLQKFKTALSDMKDD